MENDTRQPPPRPQSLIRSPDVGADTDALLAAALPVLEVRHWTATGEALTRLGLIEPTIEPDVPRIGTFDASDMWSHGFAQPDGPMRLSIAVACGLTAWTCARRFGGTAAVTSGRRRGGSVERGIARQIAEAVLRDTNCGTWTVIDDEVDTQIAAIRTLSFALDGPASPMIQLALTGASATPTPRMASSAVWFEQLRQLGGEVRLPVRSVLARPVLSAGEVARLAVGDVIPIRAPDRVALLSGRHRLAVGILDECDGHAAVRLDPQVEVQ